LLLDWLIVSARLIEGALKLRKVANQRSPGWSRARVLIVIARLAEGVQSTGQGKWEVRPA